MALSPALDDIVRLLLSMFTADELRGLARRIDEELAHTLPEGRGTLVVAERIAEAVVHRGLQAALRDRLLTERPGRAGDISILFGRAADVRRVAMTEVLDDAIRDADGSDGSQGMEAYVAGSGPDQEDLLYDTFRSMAFGRSRAAWPYIARMTADYLVNRGGRPDTFFKRTAWLLEQCEDEDIVVLGEIVSATVSVLADMADHRVAGVVRGVIWNDEVDRNIVTIGVYPGRHVERRLPAQGRDPSRYLDVVGLVDDSRLGVVHLGDGVHFPFEAGHIDRLIELFRGEKTRVVDTRGLSAPRDAPAAFPRSRAPGSDADR
jgi:hypothetical protein